MYNNMNIKHPQIVCDVISEIDKMKSHVHYIESNIDNIKSDMTQKEFDDFVSIFEGLKYQIVDTERELNKVINSLPKIRNSSEENENE